MGKIRVEVCLISARGLRSSSSTLFWKPQWFAVGWIDPKEKYCTKIDAPGNGNPVWGTKFSCSIDNSTEAILQLEVYSRDPLFLREKLQGKASVVLTEFIATRKGHEEKGSYQLRKEKSDKARGFVDVSIRVLGQGQEHDPFPSSSFAGDGVVMLVDNDNAIAVCSSTPQPYTKVPSPLPLSAHRVDHLSTSGAQPYSQPTPFPTNFSNHSVGCPTYPHASPSYLNLTSRPLIPPSSRPRYHLPMSEYTAGGRTNYINMPSSSGGGGGFGMGAGIGAIGAGAFLFGDEFVSGALDVLEG